MQWIEGVARQQGVLGVLTTDFGQNANQWHPATDLSKLASYGAGKRRIRLETDLSTWEPSSAEEYLALLDQSSHQSDNHLVFAFKHEGTEYLVPAIVLIRALFRPLHYVAPWLFQPNGLELISVPTGDESAFSATLNTTGLGQNYSEPVATKNIFTWLWAYPSAHRMWHSVYQHALQGRLGLTLPQATARAVFHGIARGNQLAVTEMRIMQINAMEASDLKNPPVSDIFILHQGAMAAPTDMCEVEQHLIKAMECQVLPLTDDQWNAVRGILENPHRAYRRKLDRRSLLDGILAKLATGMPWRSMIYEVGDWRHASTTYREWKRRGLWKDICLGLLAAC